MPRKRSARRTGRRTWIIVAVVAVIPLGGAGAVVWKVKGTSAAAVPTERTVQVTRQTIKDTIGATGTVEPKHQSEVSFTSSGTVSGVAVSVGSKVDKGDKLATISDTDLQADLTAAKADYAAAQDDLTTAQDDADSTSAELDAAESKVAVDKAKVTQAGSALAAATLRSPISGTVALVGIAKGDTVGSGSASGSTSSGGAAGSSSSTAAITVISTGSFSVDTTVGSSDVAKVKKGLQAEVTVSGSTTPVFATVSSVAVIASSSSATGTTSTASAATFDVGLDITGTQKGLYAGASATVSIIVEQHPDVLTVPTAAISTVDGKTVVNRLVDGTKVPTEITLGTSSGAVTEVTGGLAEGDQVAVSFAARAGAGGTGTRSGGTGGTGTGGAGPGGTGFGGGGTGTGTGTGQNGTGQNTGGGTR